jgi:hypothetical protein
MQNGPNVGVWRQQSAVLVIANLIKGAAEFARMHRTVNMRGYTPVVTGARACIAQHHLSHQLQR